MKRTTVVLLSAILAVLIVIAVVLIVPLIQQPRNCDALEPGSDERFSCLYEE